MLVAKIAEGTFTLGVERVGSRRYVKLWITSRIRSTRVAPPPETFTLPESREIKKIAKSKPAEHGLPFPTWILPSWPTSWSLGGRRHQPRGPRALLREEGVSFQHKRPHATPTTRQ